MQERCIGRRGSSRWSLMTVSAILSRLSHSPIMLPLYSELCATDRLYPVANRDDHIEVVEVGHVGLRLSLDGTVLSGCCKFCNNHIPAQFTLSKDILDMARNSGLIPLKQFGHLIKRKPDCITLKGRFDLGCMLICYSSLWMMVMYHLHLYGRRYSRPSPRLFSTAISASISFRIRS